MARGNAAVAPLRTGAAEHCARSGWTRFTLNRALVLRAFALLAGVALLGAFVAQTVAQLFAVREQHILQSIEQTDEMATLVAERLQRLVTSEVERRKVSNAQLLLSAAMPLHLRSHDILVGMSDTAGHVVASLGFNRQVTSIADLVGSAQAAEASRAGSVRLMTQDGTDAIVALRQLPQPFGQVVLMTPTRSALSLWREHAYEIARVAAIAALIVVLLATAYAWQHRCARAARSDSEEARARMQAALTDMSSNRRELVAKETQLLGTLDELAQSRLAIDRQSCELARLADSYSDQRRRAETACRAKADFLANMSHELRTPLNAIIGFSEIMQTELFGSLGSDKYCEYIGDIRRSGEHLLTVISNILEMSRIEAGHLVIERRPIPLRDLVAEAAVSVAGAADAKRLTLMIGVPAEERIEADRRALVKVLIHLARNAIAHTPEGGSVKIKAKLYPGHIGIHVGDTGSGIPKERLPTLGRPFERVANNPHHTSPGAGLGLSIARALVELHGGRLVIRSREGFGTVVVLKLPLPGACADTLPLAAAAPVWLDASAQRMTAA